MVWLPGNPEVTQADVLAMLRRVRDRVQVYTNYFNDDWFWPQPEAGAAV